MSKLSILSVLTGIAICAISIADADNDNDTPDPGLKVVIIRHGEKPIDGDNLSCQGMNRALQLPKVLHQKFQIPHHTYVPALDCDKSTSHSRMFQTVSPMAAKFNLKVNSKFDGEDVKDVAKDVLKKKGTVLMVWEHSKIQRLAKALGYTQAPAWDDGDYDGIWIITFANGTAEWKRDNEGITPAGDCAF